MRIATSTELQGAKIAIIHAASVLVYLRDDLPHIPNPNQWDLPGGVREDGETALACALRETCEEFGLRLPSANIRHEAIYTAAPAGNLPQREVAFFVIDVSAKTIKDIKFGEEGQRWQMMPIDAFLTHANAVPELQTALRAYWMG
ncbi:MAG: NUDIX hydrolase [Pseudomonadota bacterium]